MSKRPLTACCGANIRREKCVTCHKPVPPKYARQGTLERAFLGAPPPGGSGGGFSSAKAAEYVAGMQRMKEMASALKAKAAALAPSSSTHPNAWGAADDQWLWHHRRDPVDSLCRHLRRGDGAIKSRLEHLRDPSHAAYKRLNGSGGGAPQPPRTSHAQTPPASLNAEQREAVALASQGDSFFLTGGAGTGKSHTLHHVVDALQRRHGKRAVFITGSTGIAACHVNGTTLHAFSGVGLGKEAADVLCARVASNRTASARWQECRALVIDEVSMLDVPPRRRATRRASAPPPHALPIIRPLSLGARTQATDVRARFGCADTCMRDTRDDACASPCAVPCPFAPLARAHACHHTA